MSNRPPPPPNHGLQQAPPGMVQGGPPVNRPQQPQQLPRQQYPPVYQQNVQQGGSGPGYRADTVINASTRIHDIRPEKTESESFCKKALTSYEVYTLLPNNEDDGKDSKGSKGNKDSKEKKKDIRLGWGGKDSKQKDDSKPKKRERWAKVTINQESYPTEQIIKTIQKLDAGKLSITDKKARLRPNQSSQVTHILDQKIMHEPESQFFEWVLAQLHREEATNPNTGHKETTSMTIYLKRAPLQGLDVIQLYRERQERLRIQAIHRQNQQQAQIIHQQQQAQAMQQQQQQQQMGGGQYQQNKGVYQQQHPQQQKGNLPVKNKNASAGVKIIQNQRPGTPGGQKSPKGGKPAGLRIDDSDDYSSGSYSDSDSDDSDFSRYDSDATPHTSTSSRSGERKYPGARRPLERSRERRRGHYRNRSEDFVIVDSPHRRRSVSYAPDVPRIDRPIAGRMSSYGQPSPAIASPGFDAEAFAMGVAAATRAAIVQPAAQYAAPPPRMISDIDRAAEDTARLRAEQRRVDAEELMRQDELRVALARENAARISRPYARGGGRGGYSPPPRRYLDEDRDRVYREPPPLSPSVSSMSSAPLSSLSRERGRSERWQPALRRRSTEYDYPLRSDYGRSPDPNPFRPREAYRY
ncbi:hypothetical protein V492_07306 [Pseudogymnoascus sp. VKM F-4246]|nr:hypothetical protein V492_07306 [Pseudogymnoascus sp. VKM F-4246]